jgi:hemoglobin
MKVDIKNRRDIEILVDSFYIKVKKDPLISYFFTEVVQINWEKHLPIMYKFWENVVFHNTDYAGNPMGKHMEIHKKSPLKKSHFNRWVLLFKKTVDELFVGENAENIKSRAEAIAKIMQIKIVT